jgi:hypothetical protein
MTRHIGVERHDPRVTGCDARCTRRHDPEGLESLRVQRHRNTVVVGRAGGADSVALAVGVRTSTHTFEPVVD